MLQRQTVLKLFIFSVLLPLSIKGMKDNDTNLINAVQEKNLELVKHWVEQKANIEVENFFKMRPIHLASAMGLLEIVKYFVEKKADINSRVESGASAFDMVVMNGSKLFYQTNNALEMLKYFLEQEAEVESKMLTGPSLWSRLANKNNIYTVYSLLYSSGVDCLLKDCYKKTILDYAENDFFNAICSLKKLIVTFLNIHNVLVKNKIIAKIPKPVLAMIFRFANIPAYTAEFYSDFKR